MIQGKEAKECSFLVLLPSEFSGNDEDENNDQARKRDYCEYGWSHFFCFYLVRCQTTNDVSALAGRRLIYPVLYHKIKESASPEKS